MNALNKKINILICFGTRPEGIKLAPIIKLIENRKDRFTCKICSTGQHKEMLKQVLDFFEIKPDIDLGLMTENQPLGLLSSKILEKIDSVFDQWLPNLVLIQGDTTTAFLTALSAFYKKIKIGHVEAGLRTFDKCNPFPEEINRQFISRIADFNFTPTEISYQNLVKDNIPQNLIYITGNTAIDALIWALEKIRKNPQVIESKEPFSLLDKDKRIILVTMHRRESFGAELENMCKVLKEIALKYPDIQIVYPVHLNPNVKGPVYSILSGIENILLVPPLDYESFIWLMSISYFIITDSGRVQEEAPSVNKPVLVVRKKTERMESVELGISKLVGTSRQDIFTEVSNLIENQNFYKAMTDKGNPYGDGKASEKILEVIEDSWFYH